VSKLKKIKGIGEKTAQRVILELRGKLKREDTHSSIPAGLRVKDEALTALLTLGFQRNAVDATLDKLLKNEPGMQVEELIRQALKSL
jgi:Holliday junction DNA helicase RuvA